MRIPNTRVLFLFLLAWPLGALLVWKLNGPFQDSAASNHPFYRYNVTLEEPRDPGQWCILPRYHPFDLSVLPFLFEPRDHIHCKQRQPELSRVDDNGTLRLVRPDADGYTCVYQDLYRINDDATGYRSEKPLPSDDVGVQLTSDFVSVTCRNILGIPVYSNIHAFPRYVPSPPVKSCGGTSECPRYNVLVFGLDSMSRYGLLRLLPATYTFLTRNLSATIFRGFTKNGDNTYPNLGAMLTGMDIYSKPLVSLPYDDWPIIWKNYSRAGYRTFFSEDFPKFGLFNYPVSGLKKQPADFYMRPFWLAMENSALFRVSSHMCYGNTPKHLIQLDYLKRFLRLHKHDPFFAFSFITELTHEYMSLVTAADTDFVEFLRFIQDEGILKNTVLVFMGDHGPRYGSMLETKIGRIEERLPLVSMVLPESLLEQQPQVRQALLENSGRLTTHFDTFATFSDLLQLAESPGHRLGQLSAPPGHSLFGPISLNRTCYDAGIPYHFCVCDREDPLSVDSPEAERAAASVINTINSMLTHNLARNPCAHLTLHSVLGAHRLVLYGEAKDKLRVVVQTSPGGGRFEATVSESGTDVEGISRINRYGSQADCLRHEVLRKFCYCK